VIKYALASLKEGQLKAPVEVAGLLYAFPMKSSDGYK